MAPSRVAPLRARELKLTNTSYAAVRRVVAPLRARELKLGDRLLASLNHVVAPLRARELKRHIPLEVGRGHRSRPCGRVS